MKGITWFFGILGIAFGISAVTFLSLEYVKVTLPYLIPSIGIVDATFTILCVIFALVAGAYENTSKQ